MKKEFNTPQEMILCLMENEGKELTDAFRSWKYENFKFYFRDVGENNFIEGLKYLHYYEYKMILL